MNLCDACKDCEEAKYNSIYRCFDLCSIPMDYLRAIEEYNNERITMNELKDKIRHIALTQFIE